MSSRRVTTAIGTLTLHASGQGLTAIDWPGAATPPSAMAADDAEGVLDQAEAELTAFFAGELRTFTTPTAPAGTAFQQRVWRALSEIPYGHTTTYGAIAKAMGKPGGSRAVGAATGRNPVPIFIPCHRLVGSDGSLTGFAGGLEIKQRLLQLEQRHR